MTLKYMFPALFICALFSPIVVLAQESTGSIQTDFSATYAFQRQGVFGCNLNGAYSMSVGALSAVGGIYVPVNDAAVTLNTGYLVYKECVLRGVVNREREAATAAINKNGYVGFMTGRPGNKPLFPVDLTQDKLQESDRVVANVLSNGALDALHPALKGPVVRGIARGYMAGTRKPNREFACPYKGDLSAALAGNPQGSIWEAFEAFIQYPGCRPYGAFTQANQYLENEAGTAVSDMVMRLGWNEGVYDVYEFDEKGRVIVRTPGSIVQDNFVQLLQSGYKQLESANDIDQMVGALFAGMSTQVLSDSRGLAGLSQPTGNQPSYLDRVVQESAQGLRNAAVNAALQILTAQKQIEATFNQIMRAIANFLSAKIAELRSVEQQCWTLVIAKVCTAAPNAQNECEDPEGNTLKVATSTNFSQAALNNSNPPLSTLASSTVQNITVSDAALTLIDQLIVAVSNTSSLNAQRLALQQLDSLVAQRRLHTQSDLQQAQSTRAAVEQSVGTYITDIVTRWADNTDPNVGWCNVNNPAVATMWKERWKKK